MEVNRTTGSTIGLPGNVPGPPVSKLQSSHSFNDSPSNTNCTTHSSPSQGLGNNGSNTPYSPFNADSKTEDLVLSKNGANILTAGQNNSPFCSNESSPLPPACVSPSAANATASARPVSGSTLSTKREGIMVTISRHTKPESQVFNNYGSTSSPVDASISGISSPREQSALKSEKAKSYQSEKAPNSALVRSHSTNSSFNSGNSRRLHDNVGLKRGSTSPAGRAFMNSKFGEKGSMKNSPLPSVDYLNIIEAKGRNNTGSPCNSYPSPLSNENALPPVAIRGGVQGPSSGEVVSSAAGGPFNHMSRTSSCNSVSDLSPCSGITEENVVHSSAVSSVASMPVEAQSTSLPRASECNKNSNSNNELNNPLLDSFGDDINIDPIQSEKIRLSLEQVDTFQFPDTGVGQDDIGSNALKLSAEDVQRTLNSVSAESEQTEMSLSEITSKDRATLLDNRLRQDLMNESVKSQSDFGDPNVAAARQHPNLLSPSNATISMATSTSSIAAASASLPNAIAKATSSAMTTPISSPAFASDAFHNNCSVSSSLASSTAVSYSPSTNSSGSAKSHLQEILGVTDTNRLKNMSRPVDSSQFQPNSSTSLTSNLPKPSKSNPFQSRPPSLSDRAGGQLVPDMSQRHPFPPGSYPRHSFSQRPPPNAQMLGPMHPGYERPDAGPDRPFGDHLGGMGARPGMPFEPGMSPSHHQMHGNIEMSYNLPSPMQNMHGVPSPWQRQSSMMSPGNPVGGMGDGNKSPRGQMMSNFPPKSINPMSGLQSTVNSIPSLGSMGSMFKNNNSIGLPQLGLGAQSPILSDSRMLPPPSPSLMPDKRTDGPVAPGPKKGTKRERGQSVDSKDGDKKDSAPKSKRRKSKSKEEGRKADARTSNRSNVAHETQSNSYLYVFNTDLVNKAASMVVEQGATSIIAHHSRFQGNSRLLPSKLSALPVNQDNNFGLKSPNPVATSSGRSETKPQMQSPLPNVTSTGSGANRTPKTEVTFSPSTTSAQTKGLDIRTAEAPATAKSEPSSVKSEASQSQEVCPSQAMQQAPSPAMQQFKAEAREEQLSAAKRKHREESLKKLDQMRNLLLADRNQTPQSSSATSWPNPGNPTSKSGNYAMSQHLKKVQELNKDSALNTSTSDGWLNLVKAYNEQKRKNREHHVHSHIPTEGLPLDPPPPPYNPGAPHGHIPSRWMVPGHVIREPGRVPEGANPRFPPMGIRGQMIRSPHDGVRFPSGFPHNRFPPGYMIPGGPSARIPMYGPSVPPAGILPRGSVPRLAQPNAMGPSANEVYPFSEKLKEQASLYRSVPPESPMGPRMGSPEWSHYNNPAGPMPLGPRLSQIPEASSPKHPPMSGAIMPNPAQLPDPSMDPSLPQGVDPSLDARMGMRMTNPSMTPSYGMTSFGGKTPSNLSTHQDTPVPGMNPLVSPYPPQEMRPPSSNMPGMLSHDSPAQGGMMGDAMARRGEPRPPDLNINPALVRSPPFHPGRHPVASPGNPMAGHSQFMQGSVGPGGMPQPSPHPSIVPQSPMVNSPGMMKSPIAAPMSGQMPYMPMPQSDPMLSMDQGPAVLQGGPSSVGPSTGAPADWNSMGQSSVMPVRTPSSGPVLSSNPGPKSAISQMIEDVNRFELPNALYQNEVKDSNSPPPLTHINGNPGMQQEPPPLSHNHPSMGMGASDMMGRPHPAGYGPSPRSAGPRPVGPMGSEGFPNDFNRPLSHPGMSPNSMVGSNPSMMQPGLMEMHGPPAGYLPHAINGGPEMGGDMHPPHQSGNTPGNSRGIPEFDLTGMIPSEKPSQTLSYFPSGGGNEGLDPNSVQAQMRGTPPMTQQAMARFSSANMHQRQMGMAGNPYAGGNPALRGPIPSNFMNPNVPNYPGGDGLYSMSPSWDPMGRTPMPPHSHPDIAAMFPGRPMI